MNRIALRANITILIASLLLGGFVFFLVEYAVKADDWVVFSGSPHVYNGGNIGTGIVTDADGVILLNMNDGRVYASSETIRRATVHWIGDRNGSVDAPALGAYSAQLAGFDMLTGTYNYGDDGGVAELSLSAAVQTAALEAMGDHKGTVAVYNYKTGALICAVSTPSFDPDNVPADEQGEANEGMYLNRFVQSLYTPGSVYKIVTLAAALETIPDIREQTFHCTGKYAIGNDDIVCDGIHGDQDLKMAFRNSCNCAFAQISQQLGGERLEQYARQFGLLDSVTFDGITAAAGSMEAEGEPEASVAWSSIGQHKDQINPCGFLTFIGAIAGEGKGVTPYLVQHVANGGATTYSAQTHTGRRIMSAQTAQIVAEYMGFNVTDKYGAENFPGLTVCAKTGTGEVGGGKKPNAMFAGFVDDDAYPLAFFVAVEDGGYGRSVCVPIISKVLAACQEFLG